MVECGTHGSEAESAFNLPRGGPRAGTDAGAVQCEMLSVASRGGGGGGGGRANARCGGKGCDDAAATDFADDSLRVTGTDCVSRGAD